MPPAGLFLTPGAGSNRDQVGLVALEERLSPLPVERMDFAYRTAGRPFPDRAPKLVDEVCAGVAAMASGLGVDSGALVLGGRSMGGRICSMAVAGGLPAAGLVLICYPLHPVRKPEDLRVEHFPDIEVPCLFVSGDRDEFGSPDEFAEHLPAISGRVTTVWVPGRRHDLRNAEEAVCDEVEGWLSGL
ncbi:MAG: dienelactone hydrolase [Acidimicrobiales bacterium]|jgi:predicted alpha/beta-hydrolase family hydrolase|nr:dienelactone hydrolase [Acidimicrobiales bacterium]|tara:strand:- start:749 stop:1309 length:561 start_codon:yes stop_codon:yes gene_type:complete